MNTNPAGPPESGTEYLTVKMAAEAYSALGERYFRRAIERRQIPYFKPTGGRVLLKRGDIEEFIRRGCHDAIGVA